MMEISFAPPSLIIQGQTAGGGGEMDVEIAFEIAAESVVGKIDTRDEVILGGELFNDVGGKGNDFIKEMAIEPEEGLKFKRQSPCDMLPSGVRERIKSGFDPIVGGFFPA